eukprot:jgi/Picsp_1/1069/NSC_04552-R1_alpha- -glucosyltransferase
MAKPPMYGDYEAQRHWMEVTMNLKSREWYLNTSDNNLEYWGIDYPPLSAYQSLASGHFLQLFDEKAIMLHSSRGYESPLSKLGMRLSVVVWDLLIYLPWCLAWALCYKDPVDQVVNYIYMTCNPALLIIDHGHFQYNSISLGLTVASIYLIKKHKYILGAAMYCGALNHKQMTLYFAPAIFSHLLGLCLKQPAIGQKITMFLFLGIAVILSFSIMCVSSLVFKWKKYFNEALLAKSCALLTLAAAFPSLVMEFQWPSSKTLPLCLSNVAMSFFLFSYQVHEKSILLPLLPISLSMHRNEKSNYSRAIFNISLLSMFPLLKKDGLSLPYWGFQLFATTLNCLLSLEKRISGFTWPRSRIDLIGLLKDIMDSPIAVIISILGMILGNIYQYESCKKQ